MEETQETDAGSIAYQQQDYGEYVVVFVVLTAIVYIGIFGVVALII